MTTGSDIHDQIRPEARPIGWSTMDLQQQHVFRRVVEMISEAIRSLPKSDRRSGASPSLNDPADWISRDRSTKTVFLSGGRGSGKSSVLLSLIEATLLESQVSFPDSEQSLANAVGQLRKQVVWLEPIDMEPIPQNTNLLAAILARIDEACQRITFRGGQHREESEYGGMLDLARDYRGAMKELKRLQNRVALAWDGNLKDRSGHLDPDLYAVEVSRVEQNRLSINRALRNVLNDLAHEVFRGTLLENPLFVLPIDDFDLNPASCLQLLRLLRMISVPRLFNVVLGDMDVVDAVLNLKFSSDFADVAKEVSYESASSIPMSEVAVVAGEVASNAMRKLLPPAQRLRLANFNVRKALGFQPLGDLSNVALHTVMAGIHGDIVASVTSTRSVLGQELDNLLKFALVPGPTVFRSADTDYHEHWRALDQLGRGDLAACCERASYSGIAAFETSPRRLADIWFTLRHSTNLESATSQIGEMCLDTLLEEPAFSPAERADVEGALRRNPYGNWEWTSLPVRVRSIVDRGDTLIPTGEPAQSEAEIRIRRPSHWRFEAIVPTQASTDIGRPLSRSSAGLLVFFHDLLALGPYGSGFVSRFLSDRESEWPWAATQWNAAVLPWPAATCSSFWGLDLFRFAWQDALNRSSSSDSSKLEDLVFAWVSAGCMLIDLKLPTAKSLDSPTDDEIGKNWNALIQRLEDLIPVVNARKGRHREAAKWLANIAVLAMPEHALPVSVTDRLQRSEKLRVFWRKNHTSRAIRRARAQRLGTIINAGLPEVAEELRRRTLSTVGNLLTPTREYVEDCAETERRSDNVSEVLNVAETPSSRESKLPSRSRVIAVWKKHDGMKKPAYQELGITSYQFNKLLDEFNITKADLS